ncbi:hypothetical protein GCM10027565_24510 [Bordetella tumulicola]
MGSCSLFARTDCSLARLKDMQPNLYIVITESNVKLLGDIPDQIWTIERGAITLN